MGVRWGTVGAHSHLESGWGGRSFAPEECADLSPLKVSKLIDVLLREIDSRASSADLRKGLGP